ncbi:hypothetical protein CAPTEDRAFT_211636 [Capitella teleta]|uniref:CARD domain-containing protein n=1 Tax=Capitella teleta TaxID=283909 RepID=R7TCZ4_CAPTE|nr:hypothetical protein CAPTEDRAFT_211636 [Capitella teleta]|eukprot:ELT91618.1 hypothetical protein CAPTEDRAFT_211636 [Capitella teleta]
MTMLSEQRKQILTEKLVKLIECIKLNGLWAHLRSHKIVTKQDEARIKLNKTSHEQVGELLDHLAKGTDRDFEAFCDCLKENNQEHVVAEFLRYSAPSPSNQDVREQLVGRYSLHLQEGETVTTSQSDFYRWIQERLGSGMFRDCRQPPQPNLPADSASIFSAELLAIYQVLTLQELT